MLKLSSSLKTLSGKLSQRHSLKLPYSPPPKLDVIDPPAIPSRRSALDPRCHSPQTHADLRPTSLSFSLSLSLSLPVFSSDQVLHYSTHLKSEHSVSLCTHHHCLWSLINDRCRSRWPVLNQTEYQALVSVWLCWFFWVFVLFFFTGFDGHVGIVVVQWFLWVW